MLKLSYTMSSARLSKTGFLVCPTEMKWNEIDFRVLEVEMANSGFRTMGPMHIHYFRSYNSLKVWEVKIGGLKSFSQLSN